LFKICDELAIEADMVRRVLALASLGHRVNLLFVGFLLEELVSFCDKMGVVVVVAGCELLLLLSLSKDVLATVVNDDEHVNKPEGFLAFSNMAEWRASVADCLKYNFFD
jgi:hypothetical protein